MRRLISCLLLAFVITSGCVSPKRLFNLTPMSGDDSRNNANVWPLYYGNQDCFSVLWPIFDTNKDGFALRPLIFNEGKEWGILWPASDFDERYFRLLNLVISPNKGYGFIPVFWIGSQTRHGAGGDSNDALYQFLLGYKMGDEWGVFPFMHHGKDFSYCLPLYFHNRQSKKLLTPISYFSPTFNYFTLAWWNRENGHFGFYPLFYIGREGCRCLLWWKTPDSTGLFPIYICAKDLTAAGPVWWTRDAWGVFPFCRFGEKSSYCLTWWKTTNTAGLLPIYLNIKDFNAAGPVWWNKDSWGLFPLFSYHSYDCGKKVGILCHILGGYETSRLYRTASDDQSQASSPKHFYSYDWLCYFGKNWVRPYGLGIRHDFRMWPIFDYTSISHDHPANNEEEALRHNSICGALWNFSCSSRYKWSGDLAKECEYFFQLIKSGHKAIEWCQEKGGDLNVDVYATTKLQSINEQCQKLGLEPLDQLTHKKLDALADSFAHKYPRSLTYDRSFGMLLDILKYKQNDIRSTSFKLLWGALLSRETSPEATESTFLWRGFRQFTTPDTTSREIFPFISYYHNKKDNATDFSFAWRLFRRETSPDGNKLWFFFIPFQ